MGRIMGNINKKSLRLYPKVFRKIEKYAQDTKEISFLMRKEANVQNVAKASQQAINPLLAAALGGLGIGLPAVYIGSNIMKSKADEAVRRATLAAGGAGFATGALAPKILPAARDKAVEFGLDFINRINPYSFLTR